MKVRRSPSLKEVACHNCKSMMDREDKDPDCCAEGRECQVLKLTRKIEEADTDDPEADNYSLMYEALGPEIIKAFQLDRLLEVFGPILVAREYGIDRKQMELIMAIRESRAEDPNSGE